MNAIDTQNQESKNSEQIRHCIVPRKSKLSVLICRYRLGSVTKNIEPNPTNTPSTPITALKPIHVLYSLKNKNSGKDLVNNFYTLGVTIGGGLPIFDHQSWINYDHDIPSEFKSNMGSLRFHKADFADDYNWFGWDTWSSTFLDKYVKGSLTIQQNSAGFM